MSDYPVYHRVIAETGAVATLQEFDERDYDASKWMKGADGEPLKFDDEEEAAQAYAARINQLADALKMIGEAFGDISLKGDSRFLANKLVAYFQVQALL